MDPLADSKESPFGQQSRTTEGDWTTQSTNDRSRRSKNHAGSFNRIASLYSLPSCGPKYGYPSSLRFITHLSIRASITRAERVTLACHRVFYQAQWGLRGPRGVTFKVICQQEGRKGDRSKSRKSMYAASRRLIPTSRIESPFF